MIEDDALMKELEEIIQYAAKKMHSTITSGTEIYEMVESSITINPIGIIPLELHEGYFFSMKNNKKYTRIYQYQLSIFEKHNEKYRSIKTEYIETKRRSIAHTYESIKSDLIRSRHIIPNPAVYAIEVKLSYPIEETLLPIAKRSLVRYITNVA